MAWLGLESIGRFPKENTFGMGRLSLPRFTRPRQNRDFDLRARNAEQKRVSQP
jgi:hypothetical protein